MEQDTARWGQVESLENFRIEQRKESHFFQRVDI